MIPVRKASFELESYLASRRARVDAFLAESIEGAGAPARLEEALRYVTLGEGKRLRPILAIAACEAVGGELEAALPLGCAVEMIHAYSLVHDDLPAMDDDDLRRGRPTAHKKFDEATAILAGDALQALAFETIAKAPITGRRRTLAVQALARGAGAAGMVGGQMLDLAAEGRWSDAKTDVLGLVELAARKTGALISAAAELGAIAGGAGPKTRARLAEYGRAVGLAFQIADDLLDEEASTEEMGKRTGKDAAKGKATFPQLLGSDGARERAHALATQASRIGGKFANEGGLALAAIADWAVRRRK